MNTSTFPRWLFFLGLIGLADNIYISINHFILGPTNKFSYWMGIPAAPVGILCYLVILALTALYMKTGKAWSFNLLFAMLTMEFLSGINAFYLQAFVMKFFCPFAYLFVGVSVCMFILSLGIRLSWTNQKEIVWQQ